MRGAVLAAAPPRLRCGLTKMQYPTLCKGLTEVVWIRLLYFFFHQVDDYDKLKKKDRKFSGGPYQRNIKHSFCVM